MRKIIHALLAVSLIAVSSACAGSPMPLKENRINGLISGDYGIVTANDLAQDMKQRASDSYDRTKNLLGRYWQCVPITAVNLEYNAFMDEDPMGPSGNQTLMCDLEIIVDLPEGRHVYGDRRRHPNSFCRQFDRNWRRLTHEEEVVCLSGDDPSSENDKIFGKHRAWVWNKLKTKRGCYSYFNDCSAVR